MIRSIQDCKRRKPTEINRRLILQQVNKFDEHWDFKNCSFSLKFIYDEVTNTNIFKIISKD